MYNIAVVIKLGAAVFCTRKLKARFYLNKKKRWKMKTPRYYLCDFTFYFNKYIEKCLPAYNLIKNKIKFDNLINLIDLYKS